MYPTYTADQLGDWLRWISQEPVPTKAQQIAWGRRIQAGLAAQHRLAAKRRGMHTRNQAAHQALIQDGIVAQHEMWVANLRLVVRVARTMAQGTSTSLPDAIGYGILGLLEAVRHYDPERPTSFGTMSVNWIRQAIQRHAGDLDAVVTPSGVRESVQSARRAVSDTIPNPTPEQLAPWLRIPLEQIRAAYQAMGRPASLDAPVSDDIEVRRGDLIPDRRWMPEQTVVELAQAQALHQLLLALPAEQRQAIMFVAEHGEVRPRLLASHLGLTQAQAAQVLAQARQTLARQYRHPDDDS